jgi:predicted AAA+ superfamily ATPase
MQQPYLTEEERLLIQLENIRKQKIENEKQEILAKTDSKRYEITSKIRALLSLSNFQQRYSVLNESIKKIIFQEIKLFCEIDPDEQFKTIMKTITDMNFDWLKLSVYIDNEGCKRLVQMFDRTGAFSVEEINQ